VEALTAVGVPLSTQVPTERESPAGGEGEMVHAVIGAPLALKVEGVIAVIAFPKLADTGEVVNAIVGLSAAMVRLRVAGEDFPPALDATIV
jgi:hypothetical protein